MNDEDTREIDELGEQLEHAEELEAAAAVDAPANSLEVEEIAEEIANQELDEAGAVAEEVDGALLGIADVYEKLGAIIDAIDRIADALDRMERAQPTVQDLSEGIREEDEDAAADTLEELNELTPEQLLTLQGVNLL